jgi:hypothetical protein
MRPAVVCGMIAPERSRRVMDGLLLLLTVLPVVAVLAPAGAPNEDADVSHSPSGASRFGH